MPNVSRSDIFKNLQADILRFEGFKSVCCTALDLGLGVIKNAFPNNSFPLAAIHEFLSTQAEDIAPTNGFVAGILSSLMGSRGTALWISASRTLFPPALKSFGLSPDRFIFLDLQKEKDVIWALDEALKCKALAAVVGEVRDLDFITSRRLQLAVEKSQVTGFILRHKYRKLNTTACVSRWKITSLSSDFDNDLPGIGFPTWRVELLKIRNGKTGVWDLQWVDGRFIPLYTVQHDLSMQQKKAG